MAEGLDELARLAPGSPQAMERLVAFLRDLPETEAGAAISAIADEGTRQRLWLTRAAAHLGGGALRSAFTAAREAVCGFPRDAIPSFHRVHDDLGAWARERGLVRHPHPAPLEVMVHRRESPHALECVALDGAYLLGTSFVPVSADGVAFVTGQVHNPIRLKSILAWERYDSVLCGDSSRLIAGHTSERTYAGPHLLLGSHENFGHWLFNHFSRLMVAEAAPGAGDTKVVIGGPATRTQIDCLARAGFPEERVVAVGPGELARFERLWVPTMPFFVSGDNLIHWAPEILPWLRRVLGVEASGEGRRRLFVTRRNARWRRLVNEAEVLDALAGQGFEMVDPGTLSLAEQLRLAGEAEMIAGPFGAGMNLLLFASPRTRIVELKYRVPGMDINPYLAAALGQDYRAVPGEPVSAHDNPLNRDFTVDPQAVAAQTL